MRPKITFRDVSKSFNLYKKQSDKLYEIISFKKNKDDFYALKNISFDIFEGEAIGIVGLNGSGKSTLSNLLAQVVPPSSGGIEINGETSLIAISAGLNNQLSGMDNIELKCLMHGLSKEEIEKLKPEIIEFADIGKFIEQPVKNYSSGMKSRLGFAISVHTNPDILIIDEALSVGDQTFYDKCLVKINEFKRQGKTIIFISHSLSQVESLCNRVMWIHFGTIERLGETKTVIEDYNKFIKWYNSLSETEKKTYRNDMLNHQYQNNKQIPSSTRRTNRRKSKKKGNPFLTLQFILLFLSVLLSASLMLGLKPVQSLEKYVSSTLEGKKSIKEKFNNLENPPKIISKEINEKGIIQSEQTDIFKDHKLITKIASTSFAVEIFVEEKINDDVYKVRVNNNSGYIPKKNIKLLKEDLPITLLDQKSFLPFFSEKFSKAFEYFFIFLNTKSEEVKTKLDGIPNEETLDTGERILSYSEYDFEYKTNQAGIIESIIVKNINTSKSEWNNLADAASLTSFDGNQYLFKTNEYNIVVDLKNERIIFSSRK